MSFNFKCTAALLVMTVLVCVARADTALEQFDQIYGDKAKGITASHDPAKQTAMAEQLIGDAEQLGPDEKLKAELYLKATEYALANKDADQLAATAIGKLQSLSSPASAEGKAGLLPMLRQRYRFAENARKDSIGRLLINALEAEANAQVTAGQLTSAAPLYHEALTLAQAIDPRAALRIRTEQNSLDARRIVADRIQTLKARLGDSPADHHDAAALTRLLFLDLNDPVQASGYLRDAADPTLTEIITLATKKMDELSEDQLLKLADWLRTQAQPEPDFAKLSAFTRAQACYDRYLKLHRPEDLQRLRVSTEHEQNDAAISKLSGVKSGPVDAVASIVLIPIGQFEQRYGSAFPIDADEARSGIAKSSNQYEDWSPDRLFAGERHGKQWCLDQKTGELDVHWPTPVEGQYLLFFGRDTGSADLWKKAAIQINGGKPLLLQNVSASDDILIDLGFLTRITDLRISIQSPLHAGLSAIEIHRSALSSVR